MLPNYKDIIDKAGEPLWWDEYGVPRYCTFHPDECGVYIDTATLLIIECQSCQTRFRAATVWNSTSQLMERLRLDNMTGSHSWQGEPIATGPYLGLAPHYGDPPRHNCSGGGETMSSNTIAVAELWNQDEKWEWVRLQDIEQKWNRQLQGLEEEENDDTDA